MSYITKKHFYISLLLLLAGLSDYSYGQELKRINVGYFEAGSYMIHSQLRQEYFKQLEQILPDSFQLVSVPEGYRSADWIRSNSPKMAKQLADIKHLDMIIAVGPWVVQDLLEAGFDKPIIAMHQINPKADGLLDENNRPVVENLTVHYRPGKVYDDLLTMQTLFKIRTLGILYFPPDSGDLSLLAHVKSMGESFGFEVLSAEEYDNNGTYAFYKSYTKLRGKIDALYLLPLWGLDAQAINNFFKMTNREHIPTFIDEGGILLEKGATATNNYYGIITEARFNAKKTVDILEGKTPADLPVMFRSGYNLAINRLSASQCTVEITAELENNYRIVGDLPTEDIPLYKLNELVNRSLVQNPTYLSQTEKRKSADITQGIARADYLPQIYGQAAIGHIDKNLVHNSFDELDSKYFRSSLNLSQRLFSYESVKKIQTAKQRVLTTEAESKQVQLDLELAVSLAYLDYLHVKEKVDVIDNLRGLLDYNIEVSHALNLLDDFDSLDIMQLETKRYGLVLAATEQKHLLQSAHIILNSLLNLPGSERYLIDNSKFSETGFVNVEALLIERLTKVSERKLLQQKIENRIYNSNPKLFAADYRVKWQKSRLAEIKASYYPTLDLHASLGYNHYLKETDFFKEKKTGWEVSGRLHLPLYLGGQRFKEKSRVTAEIHAAEYDKDAVMLELMKAGQTEFKQLLSQAEQMTPAYIMKERAFNTLEKAVAKFSRNEIFTNEFINIIDVSLESEIKSIDTRYRYYASIAKIVYLMGIPVGDSFSDFMQEFHQIAEY